MLRPAPRMNPPVTHGAFRTDLAARAVYAEGAGIAQALPAGVAAIATAEDVASVVRWAAAASVPLVPRGSGSGMAGGAVGRGVIVDVSALRDIRPADARSRRVWVGAGAVRGAVDEAARAVGLRFPVDPSSGAFCTVGGMASTNAAGPHTLRHGAMRSWVTALDCVFDDGTRAIVRRGAPPPAGVPAIERFMETVRPATAGMREETLTHPGVRKDSSGYGVYAYARSGDLVDLLVGSEGTLALIVGVELALEPVPGATSSVLAEFASLEAAVEAAARARDAGASACELLDRTFLELVASASPGSAIARSAREAEAMLLVELEAPDAPGAKGAAWTMRRTFTEAGAIRVQVALDPRTEASLWSVRHAASPILARLDPALKSMQFIEDGAVPVGRLPEYVRGVRHALADRDIRGVIFGHAGDSHVHVNPLIDVRRPAWRTEVSDVLREVTALVAHLGGTLTGEHGDGRLRTPLLREVWAPAAVRAFAAVKHAFDPQGIFNPGVKVPVSGQPALEEIKYDPALPALPTAARDALDVVERERAYATPRLSLIDRRA